MKPPTEMDEFPTCYCGSAMELRPSRYGPFWGCLEYPDCEGVVGAHKDGRPKGIPAPKETRTKRIEAHGAFDPLWKGLGQDWRGRAYQYVAEELGIEGELHIGESDFGQCERIIEFARSHVPSDLVSWYEARKKEEA